MIGLRGAGVLTYCDGCMAVHRGEPGWQQGGPALGGGTAVVDGRTVNSLPQSTDYCPECAPYFLRSPAPTAEHPVAREHAGWPDAHADRSAREQR